MKVFTKAILAGLMMAVAVLPSLRVHAQSSAEPAIVISMAALDEQMNDIGYVAEAAGFGQMSFLIKMQAEQFLQGIDKENPAGVMLFFEEGAEEPSALGFVPIANMDDVLNTISQYAEIDDDDPDLITIIPDGGTELMVKQEGGYAFISDRESLFEAIPSDPAAMLDGLEDSYNMGARVYAQRIPESLRNMWMDMIEEGYADTMNEMGDLPSEFQEQNFGMQMDAMRSMMEETEELVIGFSADADGENLHFEILTTGTEGSKLAKQAASHADIPATRFAGFLMDGAAFTANACSEIEAEDAQQVSDMVDGMREGLYDELNDSDLSEEQAKMLESIADDCFEVLQDTIEEGRIDMGMVVMANETVEFALGGQIADPKKLEDAIKELVKMAEREPEIREVAEFNLNSGTLNGVRLHEITVQVPDNEEEMLDILGDEMKILVGIGEKEVYLAGGSDPEALLSKAMTSEGSVDKNLTMQFNLYVAPILKMAANIEGEAMMDEMAEKLNENGKDRVRISVSMIENGMKGSLEIQDGILELIGVAAQNMGGMMGGADF